VAADEVSFEVNDGEIFGLIGPNGAGKTTTMECIEGLRKPDRGTISVLGLDPFRQVYKLQDRIGVQLQQNVDWLFVFSCAAHNLMRLPRLIALGRQATPAQQCA
jgi:ABC-type multidrug transport system ATPase subunit